MSPAPLLTLKSSLYSVPPLCCFYPQQLSFTAIPCHLSRQRHFLLSPSKRASPLCHSYIHLSPRRSSFESLHFHPHPPVLQHFRHLPWLPPAVMYDFCERRSNSSTLLTQPLPWTSLNLSIYCTIRQPPAALILPSLSWRLPSPAASIVAFSSSADLQNTTASNLNLIYP